MKDGIHFWFLIFVGTYSGRYLLISIQVVSPKLDMWDKRKQEDPEFLNRAKI